jgi:photosystem II stability/assembly factor-like uncharacterized protein
MKYLGVVLLLLVVLPFDSEAQWKIVATLPNGNTGLGAMCFRDGRIWIADGGIMRSDDSGTTWSFINNLSTPYDLQFLDQSNGIACCQNGTYTTADGGRTWKLLTLRSATSACFVGSTRNVVLLNRSGSVDITKDGGITWSVLNQNGFSFYVTTMRDGSILYFSGTSAGGYLTRSTDLGFSWRKSAAGIDWDSYTFAVDSCDDARVYLSNEDGVSPTDQFSQVFVTGDLGNSWSQPIAMPIPFFCGSIAVTKNAIFCPTVADGVYRSVDHGQTWKTIGGPSNGNDTRLIAAINDNIIIATDILGNIWRTTNSGGDSVRPKTTVIVNPSLAQIKPGVLPCSSGTVKLRMNALCDPLPQSSFKFRGKDSLNFIATGISTDSVQITFEPDSAKVYSTNLEISFSNGEIIEIPVVAQGLPRPTITFSTSNVSNDTIGGSIYLPINVDSTSFLGSVDLSVRYDTTSLVYAGSYSPGSTVDATTTRTPGLAHIQLAKAASNILNRAVGYAVFKIFPKDNAHVCALANSPIVSTVCGKLGCGTPLLSGYLRYGSLPHFDVVPNPSNGVTSIQSDVDLGEVTIEIFDALGNRVDRTITNLSAAHPVIVHSEPYPAGAYQIRILASSTSYTLHLLHLR